MAYLTRVQPEADESEHYRLAGSCLDSSDTSDDDYRSCCDRAENGAAGLDCQARRPRHNRKRISHSSAYGNHSRAFGAASFNGVIRALASTSASSGTAGRSGGAGPRQTAHRISTRDTPRNVIASAGIQTVNRAPQEPQDVSPVSRCQDVTPASFSSSCLTGWCKPLDARTADRVGTATVFPCLVLSCLVLSCTRSLFAHRSNLVRRHFEYSVSCKCLRALPLRESR